MRRRLVLLLPLLALGSGACGRGTTIQVAAPPGASRTPPTFPRGEATAPALPDSSGWGTHVLTVERAPDGAIWVGTYGQGIYVSRDGEGREWESIRSGDSTDISWDFVNAIGFAPDAAGGGGGAVWYGTIGNGWGVSGDGGRTWRNWTFDQLGPSWLYVTPEGIAAAGDTVYIATADGLRITTDGGETYRDVTAATPGGLPSEYILGLEVTTRPGRPPDLGVWHLRGLSRSEDGGRTWSTAPPDDVDGRPTFMDGEETRSQLRRSRRSDPGESPVLHRIVDEQARFRSYPDPGGATAQPGSRSHFWFARPLGRADNPHMDQSYTYGSTMGGNFQQHQGVEFNNPEGTPVRAIGDGRVVYSGKAEAGANTVAILHDRRLQDAYVFSTYYHNSNLLVRAGDRVRSGDVIAEVGHTGRATNDHLHLEIHVAPSADSAAVVHPDVRFPEYTRNPQLWVEPLPGTGAIAGRVFDSGGRTVPGARVYGVTKPEPRETPFSFAETYEDKAHSDPVFGEHFVIGDVPAGEYVLGVEVEGRRIYRRARVAPGKVTEMEFRPGQIAEDSRPEVEFRPGQTAEESRPEVEFRPGQTAEESRPEVGFRPGQTAGGE